jgi:hypothetical protein
MTRYSPELKEPATVAQERFTRCYPDIFLSHRRSRGTLASA